MFIVLEGIDGSGKSTQTDLLVAHLAERGVEVHVTREPTNRPIGALIRQCLTGEVHFDERVLGALFMADRLDHLLNEEDGLLAHVGHHEVVVCDRYVLSSYAYHADFLPAAWIRDANRLAIDLLCPDLTLYLELPPETAAERLAARGALDKYEEISRLRSVRDAYEAAIAADGEAMGVVRVDASQDADALHAQIVEVVDAALATTEGTPG